MNNYSADISSCTVSDIYQLDGNVTFFDHFQIRQAEAELEPNSANIIPVLVSSSRSKPSKQEGRLPPVRKTVRRNNLVLQAIELPTVMNLNPRSIYNKLEEFPILLEQYEADVVCMSETWERDDLPLDQLLNLENFSIISNVKQREFRGGKPAILVNRDKYHVKHLCPEPITVPIGVEAVWVLISPKVRNPRNKIKYIAVGSIYYRGPKSTTKKELFDHIAETYTILTAKYGTNLEFIIAGDTNRLNLNPILSLSPYLKQVVKVPTRLNPDAILDVIITTLSKFYQDPVTKPPINNDQGNGKPSDHLVVIMKPISRTLDCPPRQYTSLETRPITDSGLALYGQWLDDQTWDFLYRERDAHKKAELFQKVLMEKYYELFPIKVLRVCAEDQPWISRHLKTIDRKRKREFDKNKKSLKWEKLNKEFTEKAEIEKSNYYVNIVQDLKDSNPGQWYSKVKRMSGQDTKNVSDALIEELSGLDDEEQAESIADHYASISNHYKPVQKNDFEEFLKNVPPPPNIGPFKVLKTIRKMRKNVATVKGDFPMKIISEFADTFTLPLNHIINASLQQGIYPNIWKKEVVSPVPKVFPPEKLQHLRKIAGLFNFSKIMDKILSELLVKDMSLSRDKSQYGNEVGLSVQHYLIKMLHQILLALDTNSQSESFAVIMNMIDWSQAFDRLDHKMGVQSFIDNGVRPSLIPTLLNFFQDRSMVVKWKSKFSSPRPLPGGGPQGGTLGIIEYTSQSNSNTDFLDEKEKFKFIDDLSILEIINLILQGISCYNVKQQVPSDIAIGNKFIHSKNLQSQDYLNKISNWTNSKDMKLNGEKSKYMIFNFSTNYQINTRLYLEDKLLDQVTETMLLGVIIKDDLSWHSNTHHLVVKGYQRMLILKKLYSFNVPIEDMIHIYCMYIRSILEQSSVVWGSSLTKGQEFDLERVQKVALRIILDDNYVSYQNALTLAGLPTLKERRKTLSLKFAKKCTKNEKTMDMFPLRKGGYNTRKCETFKVTSARTSRLAKSAIPTMQRQLNES